MTTNIMIESLYIHNNLIDFETLFIAYEKL